MKTAGEAISIDTNVLLRVFLKDDPKQHKLALRTVQNASLVYISNVVLAETYWVLHNTLGLSTEKTIALFRTLNTPNVRVHWHIVEPATDAALTGVDFADALIAMDGNSQNTTFISFDKKAIKGLAKLNHRVELLET